LGSITEIIQQIDGKIRCLDLKCEGKVLLRGFGIGIEGGHPDQQRAQDGSQPAPCHSAAILSLIDVLSNIAVITLGNPVATQIQCQLYGLAVSQSAGQVAFLKYILPVSCD
jgi:hypothetical protein